MDEKNNKFGSSDIFLKGSIIAIIITAISLVGFFISWHFLDDIIYAAILGVVVHVIAMCFAFKISKKIFITK